MAAGSLLSVTNSLVLLTGFSYTRKYFHRSSTLNSSCSSRDLSSACIGRHSCSAKWHDVAAPSGSLGKQAGSPHVLLLRRKHNETLLLSPAKVSPAAGVSIGRKLWARISASAVPGGGEVEKEPGGNGNSADELRAQLEALYEELDSTKTKASSARGRFIRLTHAVEQLAASAEASMRRRDEEGARKTLVEKARVMEVMGRALRRSEVLDKLAVKLAQAVSSRETQLIAALSSPRRATSAPEGQPPPVRVLGPSGGSTDNPGQGIGGSSVGAAEVGERGGRGDLRSGEGSAGGDLTSSVQARAEGGRESRQYSTASDEELSQRFLDMERDGLERLFNGAGSTPPGGSAASSAGLAAGREDNSLAGPPTAGEEPRASGRENSGRDSGRQQTAGSGDTSIRGAFDGAEASSSSGSCGPGEASNGPQAQKKKGMAEYLAEVEGDIRAAEERLAALEREGAREYYGGPGAAAQETKRRASADELRDVLAGLRNLRAKIAERMSQSPPEPAAVDAEPMKSIRKTGGGAGDVLKAVTLLRQGDQVGAAVYLQRWLEGEYRPAAEAGGAGEEEEEEDHTWSRAAGDSPQAQLASAAEGGSLYIAYLKHCVVPGELTAAPTASWEVPLRGNLTAGEQEAKRRKLYRLQRFLVVTDKLAAATHESVFEATAVDATLVNDAFIRENKQQMELLAVTLGLSQSLAQDLLGEAERAARMKVVVALLLKELCGPDVSAVDWHAATWSLPTEKVRTCMETLAMEQATALAATAAAARDVCQKLVKEALEHLSSGANARASGHATAVSAQLAALAGFVQTAALPLMLYVVESSPPSSAAADSEASGAESAPSPALEYAPGARSQAGRMDAAERQAGGLEAPGSVLHGGPEGSPQGLADGAGGGGNHPIEGAGGAGGEEESAAEQDRVARRRMQLLRLLRVGGLTSGNAERLLGAYCEDRCRRLAASIPARSAEGASQTGGDEVAGLEHDTLPVEVVSQVLGLSDDVGAALERRTAVSVYSERVKLALEKGQVSDQEWSTLAAQADALGLSESDSARLRDESAARVVGAACKKLLDKRNRGSDMSTADVTNLVALCTSLRVTELAGVEMSDRVTLFRRAALLLIEPTSSRFAPLTAVQKARGALNTLRVACKLLENEADDIIGQVARASAARWVTQARASLLRNDPELTGSDLRRLILALGMLPLSEAAHAGGGPRGLTAAEAQQLHEIYCSQHASWRDPSGSNTGESLRARELEDELHRRLQTYLGV
eukprot:jgi/Mesen1/9755/ME000007S09812